MALGSPQRTRVTPLLQFRGTGWGENVSSNQDAPRDSIQGYVRVLSGVPNTLFAFKICPEYSTRRTLSYKLRHTRPQWNRKQRPKEKGGIKNTPIYIISSHRFFGPPANLNKLFSTTGWFRHVRPCTTGIITSKDYLKTGEPQNKMPLRSRKTWPQRPPNSVM